MIRLGLIGLGQAAQILHIPNIETVDKIRKIQRALYPKPYYALLNDSKYKYEPKRNRKNGSRRLCSRRIGSR